jgi:hypothetical protein
VPPAAHISTDMVALPRALDDPTHPDDVYWGYAGGDFYIPRDSARACKALKAFWEFNTIHAIIRQVGSNLFFSFPFPPFFATWR